MTYYLFIIMNTINLSINSYELKKNLNINFCFGENFFTPSANVKPKELIPILLLDDKQNYYLHIMRWGIDVFGNADYVGIARFENIMKYPKWRELLQAQQTCVMVLKGYYYHDHKSIFNAANGTMKRNNNMYYIHTNAKYMYVAGLYEKRWTHKGIKYGMVALTTDSINHEICNRMPLLLNNETVDEWLKNGKIKVLNNEQSLTFKEIGFWIQDKTEKRESIILQSKEKWIMDQDAKDFGFEDPDFPWDILEQTALDIIKNNNKHEKDSSIENVLPKQMDAAKEEKQKVENVDEEKQQTI